MKTLLATLSLCLFAFVLPAHAASHKEAPAMAGKASACEAQATEKKLAGAAKDSFMKKCEKDAMEHGAAAGCEAKATEQKLAGAAKTSFVKKCEKDAAK